MDGSAKAPSHRGARPIFVPLRNVHLGWVENWDQGNKKFLITFSEEQIDSTADNDNSENEFELISTRKLQKQTQSTTRPDQHKFRFEVFKRYKYNDDGKTKCALTALPISDLLDAVHLYPKRNNGSDDPRNGLPLAPTVHRALDKGLIGISPEDFSINGDLEVFKNLGIKYRNLNHLQEKPAAEALNFLWKIFQKANIP